MKARNILKYVGKGICIAIYSAGAYSAFMLGCGAYNLHAYERCMNKRVLEAVVAEEAAKLGLDPSEISVEFNDDIGAAGSGKVADNEYIILTTPDFANRPFMRHELYHIYKGDCDRVYDMAKDGIDITDSISKNLHYFLLAEPRATIYETFGIRL